MGLPSQGAGLGEGQAEFGPVPTGQAELAIYIRELEGDWHAVMAEMVSGDMGETMEKFAGLQSRLHRIAARAKVANIKLSAASKGVGPKGPYLAPADEAENDYPDFNDEDSGYGPKGTTRAATDTPTVTTGLADASTPFGTIPLSG